MLASSSDRVTVPLSQDALEVLEPPGCVRFKEVILPILKNKTLSPYDKVSALMDLPGVYGVFENLRLYDQVFRLNRGPNKVQLSKLWELLCKELITHLHAEDIEIEPGGAQCHDIEAAAMQKETKLYQDREQEFLVSWLRETAGPPASPEWIWDNRDGYGKQLADCVKKELRCLKTQCAKTYDLLACRPGGPELLAIPRHEILQRQYLTQLGAHPLLKWIDCADILGAFDGLCDVKAFGDSGDDNEALLRFMELVSTDSDFTTGPAFWQNVYKLWLSNFASLSRPSFHSKMQKFVDAFNSRNMAEGLSVSVGGFHTKTFQELKACESEYGKPGYQTHDERVVASKILDTVSCRMIANSAATVAQLVYEFGKCSLDEEKFELVQVQNGFHNDAQSCDAPYEVVLNIAFKGGPCHGHGAREGRSYSIVIVGEVRIVLPQINSAVHGIKLLSEFVDDITLPSSN
eukprot:gnl/MRDRNA2_/MRDRNA2_90429_c0_seq1.p1 gnl/MRDRNA2_/MRDRNA2_90429_c0~~gnl/MRDRNA2_/MRDRNA2_90429_c0_seq1.p1  ORF type:complete len:491 (-),score=64.34 gnl/MRDRNA2_/MRDRNA2_90429_c0_seq1:224-1606(-)